MYNIITNPPGCLNKRNLIILGAVIGVVLITIIIIIVVAVSGPDKVKYTEIDGILGNPLKGFAGWANWPQEVKELYPYSIAYFMIGLQQIWPEEDYIDYNKLDEILNKGYKNRRQMIMRLCLDYPNQDHSNTPEWVFKKVKNITYWADDGQENVAVDYNDPETQKIISTIHQKIAEKFDGDKRIAYWQLGTYGHWGEFHEALVEKGKRATEETVDKIYFSLYDNMKKTPLQVRYALPRCINTSIGFFHDTFCNPEHDYWMDRDLNETGLWDRYKTNCFGGKIYSGHRTIRFKEKEELDRFKNDVEKYHVSYLFDYDFYEHHEEYLKDNPDYIKIRNKIEYRMGYNYYIKEAKIDKSSDSVEVEFDIHNKGVAPFYEDYKIVFGILQKAANGTYVAEKEVKSDQSIKGVLEGQTKKIKFKIEGINKKEYILGFRIPSPMEDLYVLFSNKEQTSMKAGGWFILKDYTK